MTISERAHRYSMWPRFFKKAALWLLVPALVAAGVTVMALRSETDEAKYGQHARLIAELRHLVGDNGLFMRPGLSSDAGVSWSASAYGTAALASATDQKVSLRPTAALTESLTTEAGSDPVWTPWYGVQVEGASGSIISGDWTSEILKVREFPADPARQIAAIAAVADVVAAKQIPLPATDVAELGRRLDSVVPSAPGAYSRCRALQAAQNLGLSTHSWKITVPEITDFGPLFSAEAVMNVYGMFCLAEQLNTPQSDTLRKRVLAWLRPQISLDVAGLEMESYFVTQSWIMAGGQRSELRPLIDKLRARIDPASGLFREHVVRLGTLEHTYHAALLADIVGAFRDIVGNHTLSAVRELVPTLRTRKAMSDMLMATVIFRLAGVADPDLEDEATQIVEEWLRQGVRRDNVVEASRIVVLLQQLGRPAPKMTATAFAVSSAEDRYLAWTMLTVVQHLNNGAEVKNQLAEQSANAVVALAHPDELMVKEVVAGLGAAGTGIDRNHLPDDLLLWAKAVRGCEGHQTLYRPLRVASQCTLEATVQMLAAGLDAS